MGEESSYVVRYDLGRLYNLLIIGARGLQCETNL